MQICLKGIGRVTRLCVSVANYSSRAKKRELRENTICDVSVPSSWTDNQAYVFGFSATGALGIERLVARQNHSTRTSVYVHGVNRPLCLSELRIPVNASCGYGFTVYICKKGHTYSVFGCGINSDGQLGQQSSSIVGNLSGGNEVAVVPTPQPITLPLAEGESELVYPALISCGRAHTVIGMQPRSNSTVSVKPFLFTLGNNAFGQCGRQFIEDEIYGPRTAVISKVNLSSDVTGLKQVCCGQDHSLVLCDKGSVFSAGLGTDGQTGLGHLKSVDQFSPILGAIQNVRISHLASSGDTVLAVSESGRLYAWGNNEYGQIWPSEDVLQVPEPIELPLNECVVPSEAGSKFADTRIGRVVSAACAGSMCCLVDDSGHVFVWGFGCIGLGPTVTFAFRPTLIPPGLFVPAYPDSPERIVSVTSGLHHFIVRSSRGLLWAWGAPRGGLSCLGLGNQIGKDVKRQTYPFPLMIPGEAKLVACGVDHTVVLAKSFA